MNFKFILTIKITFIYLIDIGKYIDPKSKFKYLFYLQNNNLLPFESSNNLNIFCRPDLLTPARIRIPIKALISTSSVSLASRARSYFSLTEAIFIFVLLTIILL